MNESENTFLFSSFSTNDMINHYNLGLSYIYFGFPLYNKLKNPRQMIEKTKFCICIVSNDSDGFRKQFIEKLSEYKSIDCYGKLFKNQSNHIIENSSWYNPMIYDIIQQYKFMICMENKQKPDYWTEKIVNGFIGNTIPIYWGDPNITDIFNEQSFININKFGLEQGIEEILLLDSNDTMYNEMFSSPPINNNKYEKYYNEEYYKNYINNIFNKINHKKTTNDINNFFKHKLVINLDRRSDRYQDFCTSCPFDYNIIERISAIDGKDLDMSQFTDYKINNGAIGCFLSHIKTWEIVQDNNDFSIIFEDDITFSNDFNKMLPELINQLNTFPNDRPILCYISGRFSENYKPFRYDEYDKINDNMYYRKQNKFLTTRTNNWNKKVIHGNEIMLTWERCTSCLIMNGMAAKRLLEITKELPDIPIDTFLFKLNSYTNLIDFYDFFPHVCYSPYAYKSDIRK
jgi:GR25 family glycosyltransferase involved in LPS biosynthesis